MSTSTRSGADIISENYLDLSILVVGWFERKEGGRARVYLGRASLCVDNNIMIDAILSIGGGSDSYRAV